jgi:hypothetical protein
MGKTAETEDEHVRNSSFSRGHITFLLHRQGRKRCLLLNHPFWLVAYVPTTISVERLRNGNAGQMNTLHRRPNNREATGLSRKGIDLVGPLPNIAEKAFNGIRAANIPMHHRRERIKREKMLLVFTQAAYGFGVPLLVFGECLRLD